MNVNFIYKNIINFKSNIHSSLSPYLIIVESNEIIEKLIYHIEFINCRHPHLFYYESNDHIKDHFNMVHQNLYTTDNNIIIKGYNNIFEYIINKMNF